MSTTHPVEVDLAEVAVTPGQLLEYAAHARRRADAAERELLAVAVEWAHAHPETPADADHTVRASWRASTHGGGPHGDGGPEPTLDDETWAWFGIPAVRWDAPASFAAAVGITTSAGRTLLRDALVLTHRMPRLQARLDTGDLPVWRARRIAAAAIGHPADVVTHLDQTLAPVAHTIGTVALDHRIDQAMLLLHAEEREQAQLDDLDRRHATLHERSINHTGIAEMTIRADWSDLTALDTALTRVAHALSRAAASGTPEAFESHDVRRTRALAILADPARALALLEPHTDADAAPSRPTRPQREIYLRLHLTDANLFGLDPVATDAQGRAWLDAAVRAWCGRTDTHLTVHPVLDTAEVLNHHPHDTGYAIPEHLRRTVGVLEPTCAFPWCTRPTHTCDLDHRDPYRHPPDDRIDGTNGPDHGGGGGGPTCPCNLAPLCRHHHQLKTHTAWTYTTLEPGLHLWTDPRGRHYLRDHDRTTAVPSSDRAS